MLNAVERKRQFMASAIDRKRLMLEFDNEYKLGCREKIEETDDDFLLLTLLMDDILGDDYKLRELFATYTGSGACPIKKMISATQSWVFNKSPN